MSQSVPVSDSPRNSRLARLAGQSSADPRDVKTRLDRALTAAARNHDEASERPPRPVQLVGEAHTDPVPYRRWRERQLRKVPGATVPELEEGHWALVLWALRPALLVDFVRHGRTKGLLTPPYVGRYRPGVAPEVALAGGIAAWLEGQDRGAELAPPLLRDADGPFRLVTLDREWKLPATEFMAALPGRQTRGE